MGEKIGDIVEKIETLFKERLELKNQTIQNLRNRLDIAERENVRLISEKIE